MEGGVKKKRTSLKVCPLEESLKNGCFSNNFMVPLGEMRPISCTNGHSIKIQPGEFSAGTIGLDLDWLRLPLILTGRNTTSNCLER